MKEVGLIGPGRLGRTLATLLPSDSYQVGPVLSSNFFSARRAVREMGRGDPIESAERFETSQIILASPPEEQLDSVLSLLQEARIAWRGKTFLHTCVRENAAALQSLRSQGAAAGGIYPLQIFQRPARALSGVYFAVSGDLYAVREARKLVRSWGGQVVPVTPEQRQQASLGALVASDVLTGIMDLALTRMIAGGFTRKRGLDALRQVVAATVEDYVRSGRKSRPASLLQGNAASVLTGLDALNESDPLAAEQYRSALRLTLDILEKDAAEFAFLDRPRSRGASAGGG